MSLSTDEFIRRFLLHVLPAGFMRIRHYGLFAAPVRRVNLTRLRHALAVHCEPEPTTDIEPKPAPTFVCRSCGTALRIVEVLNPRTRAPP
jgi:hypothetical protein